MFRFTAALAAGDEKDMARLLDRIAGKLYNGATGSTGADPNEQWATATADNPVVDEKTRQHHRDVAAYKQKLDAEVAKQHEISNRLHAEMFSQEQRLKGLIQLWQGKFLMVKQENNTMRRKMYRKENEG